MWKIIARLLPYWWSKFYWRGHLKSLLIFRGFYLLCWLLFWRIFKIYSLLYGSTLPSNLVYLQRISFNRLNLVYIFKMIYRFVSSGIRLLNCFSTRINSVQRQWLFLFIAILSKRTIKAKILFMWFFRWRFLSNVERFSWRRF